MIKHKFIVALFTLCYLLTACVAEDLQGPVAGSGEGYLVLQVGSVSAEVQSAPLTKATTALTDLGVTLPSVDKFTITIKDSNGSTVKTGTYGELKQSSSVVLPKGTYTVEASQGDDLAIQDKPYFYGSESVTITTGTNIVSLSPKLANAIITPVVSEGLNKHYKNWTLNACIGTDTKELATSSNTNSHLFAKKGEMVSFIFSGTNKLGIQTSSTWNMSNAIDACMNYRVQCDPALSICSAITVKGTIDPIISDGWLRGSELTLSYTVDNGADISAISAWHVDVKYNDMTIRTYDSSAPNDIKMDQNPDWPYIPKDSEITAYVTIEGDQIPVNTTKVANPISFGIDVTAETTYSLYQSQGAAAANEKDGSSIFNIGSTVKIAQEILNKYPELLSNVTYTENIDNFSTTAAVGASTTLNDLSWAQHYLTAHVSFDGTTQVSSAITCEVTGLPYTLTHPADQGKHPWYVIQEGSQPYIKFTGTHILLRSLSKPPIVGLSAFHIPENTLDFQLNCNYYKNVSSWGSYTFYIKLLNPTNNNMGTTICSHNSKSEGNYTLSSDNGTFNTTYSAISCEYGYEGGLTNYCSVYSISINYR